MPYRETEVEKRYWHVGEVAAMIGVNTSRLRFWETEFSMSVKRGTGGKRLYTAEEIERLKQIHHLVKVERYTLEGAAKKLGIPGRPKKSESSPLEAR